MSDKKDSGFTRYIPQTTSVLEKPMHSWASGKIKRLYDGYESFCQEIGQLLGDPAASPQVSTHQSPEMIDELDFLWEKTESTTATENVQQLLTLLSGFFKAGFVVSSFDRASRVQSYFIEDEQSRLSPLLEATVPRLTPYLSGSDEDLKPVPLNTIEVLSALTLSSMAHTEDLLAFHFWLYPDEAISLVVLLDVPEKDRHAILLKTAALIQRRFYD